MKTCDSLLSLPVSITSQEPWTDGRSHHEHNTKQDPQKKETSLRKNIPGKPPVVLYGWGVPLQGISLTPDRKWTLHPLPPKPSLWTLPDRTVWGRCTGPLVHLWLSDPYLRKWWKTRTRGEPLRSIWESPDPFGSWSSQLLSMWSTKGFEGRLYDPKL